MENLIWLIFVIIIIGNGIAKILKQRSGQKPSAPEENGEQFKFPELPEIFKREFPVPPVRRPQPPKPRVVPAAEPVEPEPSFTLPPPIPVEVTEEPLVEAVVEPVPLEHLTEVPAGGPPPPGAEPVSAFSLFEKDALLEGVVMSVLLGPPRARTRRLYLLGRAWRPAP